MTLVTGLVTAGILFRLAFFALGKGRSRKDRSGPHNNWRVNKSTTGSANWDESFSGYGADGTSGGGSD
jgi:hypothetical protein